MQSTAVSENSLAMGRSVALRDHVGSVGGISVTQRTQMFLASTLRSLPRRRASVLTVAWLCVAGVVISSGTLAVAQQATQQTSELDDPKQREQIEVGVRLERSRLWKDAISHYSDALRDYPDSRYLQYGLRRSKIHFSIDRRYGDPSFLDELSELSVEECFTFYDDILGRVRTHFVDPISDTSIVAHGTESLWLALANHKFLDQNLFGVDPAALKRLRDTLHKQYWNKDVSRGGGARATILEISRLAQREVSLAPSAVVLEYIFGACNCLDDYSNVLTPGRLDDLYSNIDGEFVGIGIVMEAKPGHGMKLINVLPNSPAADGGVRPGDLIVEVDGTDVREMSTDEAAGLLTGKSGSRVALTVEKKGGRLVKTACVRRRVEVKSLPIVEMVDADAGIGYVRMTGFQKSTPREMDAALAKLRAAGMQKLIWDVRGNPGGLLPAAVEVLDRFIDNGVLVSTRGRANDQNFSYSAKPDGTWNGDLVLLIDGRSASASEIVAGAIRDHRRGTIVGRKSFGKWSVQSIYPTMFSSGLRLTTAKFYSPDGKNYGRKSSYDTVYGGLKPDHVIAENDEDPIIPGFDSVDPNDPDVAMAVNLLQRGNRFSAR